MILPKGIVKNTDAIYAALASFSTVPPEILWGCWHGICFMRSDN